MTSRLFSFIAQRRAYLEKYGPSLSRLRKAGIFEELSCAYSHLKQLYGLK
ncbi:hypothetical protein [Dipodfec virus UOA04_Rod_495]|nr:hypothetical protein [Dipodfec virus UOA04_Rod_495]